MRVDQIMRLVSKYLIRDVASLVVLYAGGLQGFEIKKFTNEHHVESVNAVGEEAIMLVLRNGNRRLITHDGSFMYRKGDVTCFICVSDTLAACGSKGQLKLCHPTEIKTYRWFENTGRITCLARTTAGEIVSGSANGQVCVWNVNSPTPVWKHNTYCEINAIASRGEWVVVCFDTRVRAVNFVSGEICDFNGHEDYVSSLCFIADTFLRRVHTTAQCVCGV